MKAAVITFPGSNCNRDLLTAIEHVTGTKPISIWHQETELPKVDFIGVPGGFSYGDYLRCGAMAAQSPIMREVKKAADQGRYVLGICNGFQILTEAGLLPGALMRNLSLHFICKTVSLKIEQRDTAFTSAYKNKLINIPIAHHDGNYVIEANGLKSLEDNGMIAFRYVDSNGNATGDANPNGSTANIAGVFNKQKNILGMMPHPERAVDPLTGSTDGSDLFRSLMQSLV